MKIIPYTCSRYLLNHKNEVIDNYMSTVLKPFKTLGEVPVYSLTTWDGVSWEAPLTMIKHLLTFDCQLLYPGRYISMLEWVTTADSGFFTLYNHDHFMEIPNQSLMDETRTLLIPNYSRYMVTIYGNRVTDCFLVDRVTGEHLSVGETGTVNGNIHDDFGNILRLPRVHNIVVWAVNKFDASKHKLEPIEVDRLMDLAFVER